MYTVADVEVVNENFAAASVAAVAELVTGGVRRIIANVHVGGKACDETLMSEILTSANTTHRERYSEGSDVMQYGEIVGEMVAGGIVPPSRGSGKVSSGSR